MSIGTVLIVDDDRAVRHSLSLLLREEGFDVQTYMSGRDCIENCDFRDVICALLDYHLPSMNGLELAEVLRRDRLGLPVILMSSILPASIEDRARAMGIQAVLLKPPNVEELCGLIHTARDRFHSGRAQRTMPEDD